ncbi:hypothetical protein SUDANB126_01050 [Streptomyces sp. enrichment culture]
MPLITDQIHAHDPLRTFSLGGRPSTPARRRPPPRDPTDEIRTRPAHPEPGTPDHAGRRRHREISPRRTGEITRAEGGTANRGPSCCSASRTRTTPGACAAPAQSSPPDPPWPLLNRSSSPAVPTALLASSATTPPSPPGTGPASASRHSASASPSQLPGRRPAARSSARPSTEPLAPRGLQKPHGAVRARLVRLPQRPGLQLHVPRLRAGEEGDAGEQPEPDSGESAMTPIIRGHARGRTWWVSCSNPAPGQSSSRPDARASGRTVRARPPHRPRGPVGTAAAGGPRPAPSPAPCSPCAVRTRPSRPPSRAAAVAGPLADVRDALPQT